MVHDNFVWGEGQKWDFSDVKLLVEEFYELYLTRPIKSNTHGMKSVHLFWTWYALRKLDPGTVIESGVYKGLGTWMIEKACPKAKIYSIEPNNLNIEYYAYNAEYYTKDFSLIYWDEITDIGNTVCFFDDHQDAYERLLQMKFMGFKKAIFEDNYPAKQGDCYSLNKIFHNSGFVTDEVIIPPNDVHAKYVRDNVASYMVFPPLFKKEKTRWHDGWNDVDYPTPSPIFDRADTPILRLFEEEADSYTWICYAELK